MADPGTWDEIGAELRPADPLDFFDTRPYLDRLSEAQLETGLSDAFLGGLCALDGRPVALGVMDFRFMGGSMGSVVGERFARLASAAARQSVPLIVVAASGGARMQEGILSLMQMAKTVVALDALAAANLPFVTVLTHPTTGGVLASFATLADVIISEPGALLCFAGPRVIEQTTRERLPEGFGRAEANLANGQIDMIVSRHGIKRTLGRVLDMMEGGAHVVHESPRPDPEVVSRGSRPFARAFTRAKELAVAPRGWLRRRDTQDRDRS
jgi:acetyl-CoA carboxylase carboxyl transferase subunit beta